MKLPFMVALVFLAGVSISSAYAVDTFLDDVELSNGKSVFFSDHAISVSRTNTDGNAAGSFLNLRGFDGVVIRTGGDGTFGTGTEKFRVADAGVELLQMASGKSIKFVDEAVSVARTNTDGNADGSFLNLRGFSGIVLRTGGDGTFGTGDERLRVTPTEICIGNCAVPP